MNSVDQNTLTYKMMSEYLGIEYVKPEYIEKTKSKSTAYKGVDAGIGVVVAKLKMIQMPDGTWKSVLMSNREIADNRGRDKGRYVGAKNKHTFFRGEGVEAVKSANVEHYFKSEQYFNSDGSRGSL